MWDFLKILSSEKPARLLDAHTLCAHDGNVLAPCVGVQWRELQQVCKTLSPYKISRQLPFDWCACDNPLPVSDHIPPRVLAPCPACNSAVFMCAPL